MSANITSNQATEKNKKYDQGGSVAILVASIMIAGSGIFGAFAATNSSSEPESTPSPVVEQAEEIGIPITVESGSSIGGLTTVESGSTGLGVGIPADN